MFYGYYLFHLMTMHQNYEVDIIIVHLTDKKIVRLIKQPRSHSPETTEVAYRRTKAIGL